ncbi:immunoglobulin-like domain-containing protein [Thomasclavelia sp.]
MLKIKSTKLIIISIFLMLVGCSSSSLNSDNPLGLKLSVSDVSNTGLRLTCNQSDSNLHEEVTTDLKYWIEKFENNEWVELEYTSPSVHWDETVVNMIPKNGDYFWTLYWAFYGELSSGQYRVKKIFKYEGREYEYYAEFQIG